MKAFITKYALTTGIDEVDAEICADISPNMIAVKISGYGRQCFHKPDWHTTREDAVARAEAMRVAKIASHRKSLAKLETLRFT